MLRPAVSQRLRAEYQRVLSRPKWLPIHGFTVAGIEQFLDAFLCRAEVVEPPTARIASPDPDDQLLWDLLAFVGEAVPVSGDKLLCESGHFPGRILSPREFVDHYLPG